ncbi:MFS transporter [Salinisphaera sp. LB1]|uniref:MFS transporter n=1 Tax=Salinisphaera sp. LB1 TaxID=2183911 RepID=UPI000D7D60A5|nr:MFS transporter [Salinisphaera sp. LB1]AWN15082.1 MFS general substrate transporter [Salinisphaera sp. LB1]
MRGALTPAADSVLRDSAFLKLLTSRLTAATAVQIQSVVVGWQLYAMTHSALTLGWVGLAQFLPMAALVLPAGDAADRLPRRLLLIASAAIMTLVSLIFLVLTLSGTRSPIGFFATLALFGVARSFSGPSLTSLLPQIVGEARLPKAIAINSSVFQIAVIGGPAIGGAIYLAGPSVAYAVCAALFGVAAASVALIRRPLPAKADTTTQSAFARFTAGIVYVRSRPIILGAISLDLFAVLLGGATALLPVYAHSILHTGPAGLGGLRSAVAVGAFAMGLYLSRVSLNRRAGPTMFVAVAVFGLGTIVFGLSTDFALSFLALAVMGAADMISMFVRSSLIQLATPDAMRGRVNAVNMLFIGASNELGEFESGVTAGLLGTVPAVVLGGLGTLAVAGAWLWLFPALRRVDRLEDVGRPPGTAG